MYVRLRESAEYICFTVVLRVFRITEYEYRVKLKILFIGNAILYANAILKIIRLQKFSKSYNLFC